MPTYTVICFRGNEVTDRSVFDAEDDAEARALLVVRGERADCELWCGERKVGSIRQGEDPVFSYYNSLFPPEINRPLEG